MAFLSVLRMLKSMLYIVNEIGVAKEDRLFMYIKKRNFADVSKH